MSDMILKLSTPSEKQKLFLTDTHRYVAYGGARGGGKSWAVRTKAILLCLAWPGIKCIIIRNSYTELRNNHIMPLLKQLAGAAVYNKQEKIFTFPNGSTIAFGYCASDADLGQYQGAEYDVIFLDEAGLLQEEWIRQIIVCCRGVNNFPKRVYYTLNPGGVSHGYFKRLFIDRRFQDNERPEDYGFIQALVKDNPALLNSQPEYLHTLEALPPKLRKAWLEGSWDIFSGQFFEDFVPNPPAETAREEGTSVEELRRQRRWCHVIEPFDIPKGWTILRSYDFGYGKPFSVGWWAVDYGGVLYRILELYGCTDEPNTGVKWTPEEQARKVAEIEGSHPWLKGRKITGVADPAIWDASRGESIAETFSKYRVYFTPGDHQRIPGWMQVHYRLQFDENGFPRMYVFEGCQAFIRTIPLLQYDKTHVEDIDTTLEDHVADEVRYLCMSRPVTPLVKKDAEPIYFDPLNQMGRRKNKWTNT